MRGELQTSFAMPKLGLGLERAKAALARFRVPLFAAGLALFAAGLWWSVSKLELSWSDLNPFYLAALAVILVPLGIAYGAINFMVMTRAAGLNIPFSSAFTTTCIAQFAAILPLPGGALVRGGAMMARGSSMGGAASHVTVNAVLWIACAAMAAGLSLGTFAGSAHPIAIMLTAGGVIGAAACVMWLTRKSSAKNAAGILALRLVGVALSGLRLTCAFYIIGQTIHYADAFPFAFASILGTASSLAPAGLGVSEALAAAIATLSGIGSAAAFLAVGINRIVGIAISGILTGIISLRSARDGNTENS